MRLKASIETGAVVPSVILRKLAAAGAGKVLSRALRALGRIERTLFTCNGYPIRRCASDLSLITAAIVHWSTVYLDRAVRQLRAQGATVPGDLPTHVAPLGWEHIGLDR